MYLIYNFIQKNEEMAFYRALHLFSGEGELSPKSLPTGSDIKSIAFESKEDLLSFAEEIALSEGHKKVQLISVEDFNIGIESCETAEQVQTIFSRFGSSIELGPGESRKGFLGKIFR